MNIVKLLESGKRESFEKDSKICYKTSALQFLFSDMIDRLNEILEHPESCPFAYCSTDSGELSDSLVTWKGSWKQVWNGIIIPLHKDGKRVGTIKEIHFEESEIKNSMITAKIESNFPLKLVIVTDIPESDTEMQLDTVFVSSTRLKGFRVL